MEFTFAGGTMSESDFVRRLRNNLPREYDPAKMAVAAWDTHQDTVARNHQYFRDISDTIRPAPMGATLYTEVRRWRLASKAASAK